MSALSLHPDPRIPYQDYIKVHHNEVQLLHQIVLDWYGNINKGDIPAAISIYAQWIVAAPSVILYNIFNFYGAQEALDTSVSLVAPTNVNTTTQNRTLSSAVV